MENTSAAPGLASRKSLMARTDSYPWTVRSRPSTSDEEVFDAGEGGAELGDQLGQVGDEPAALAGPLRGGVDDGPLDLFGQADVVHDHAGGLHEPGRGHPGAVRAGDRLEQGVGLQRLVQVEDALVGGVEPGHQLRGHHQEAQRVVRGEEPPLLLLLLGLREPERPHGGVFVLGVRDGDVHLGGDPVVLPDLGEHL